MARQFFDLEGNLLSEADYLVTRVETPERFVLIAKQDVPIARGVRSARVVNDGYLVEGPPCDGCGALLGTRVGDLQLRAPTSRDSLPRSVTAALQRPIEVSVDAGGSICDLDLCRDCANKIPGYGDPDAE